MPRGLTGIRFQPPDLDPGAIGRRLWAGVVEIPEQRLGNRAGRLHDRGPDQGSACVARNPAPATARAYGPSGRSRYRRCYAPPTARGAGGR